jgi:hypothetical protein
VVTLSDAEHASKVTEVCTCCIAREAVLVNVFAVLLSSATGFEHGDGGIAGFLESFQGGDAKVTCREKREVAYTKGCHVPHFLSGI